MPTRKSTSPPRIETVAVMSSSMNRLSYHSGMSILQVEFHDGSVYRYLDVPMHAYRELLRADSKGAHFNHHIRNVFAHAVDPMIDHPDS